MIDEQVTIDLPRFEPTERKDKQTRQSKIKIQAFYTKLIAFLGEW